MQSAMMANFSVEVDEPPYAGPGLNPSLKPRNTRQRSQCGNCRSGKDFARILTWSKEMPTATLTTKGQVTIPKSVRDLLRIEAGDQIDFFVTEQGDVYVRGLSVDVRELRGMLKRNRQHPVSVDDMNAAILREHSRKR
jgi:AbrB family looped-hinge helix DNA binding protein